MFKAQLCDVENIALPERVFLYAMARRRDLNIASNMLDDIRKDNSTSYHRRLAMLDKLHEHGVKKSDLIQSFKFCGLNSSAYKLENCKPEKIDSDQKFKNICDYFENQIGRKLNAEERCQIREMCNRKL